jgi:hypothetical protein
MSPQPASDVLTDWLPEGKRAAVVWTIDDVHPGRSSDAYEAGGDLGQGVLGHVEWLLERHPNLHVTLFTTADWRQLRAQPSRRLVGRVPLLRDRVFLTPIRPKGSMALDRHPEFVAYLRGLPRTEVALHGLHHVHPGLRVPVEFQDQSPETCQAMLLEALEVFDRAGLDVVRGMTPPGWNLPPGLAAAMTRLEFLYVASARDVLTPVTPGAVTAMSGLRGASLIQPQRIEGGRLLHFTTNFQATNDLDRALQIVEQGGLLAVKAHIVKTAFGHVQLDGLDALYRNYLDLLFKTLEERYGDELWWTSMGEIARQAQDGAAK